MESIHEIFIQPSQNMSNISDESVSLVVTSPPYPMIEMWDEIFSKQNNKIRESLESGDGFESFELMNSELDKVWSECFRVLKPGGFACINIGDATRTVAGKFRLYTNHSRITQYCEKIGFQSLPVILWRKQTNAPNKFMGSGMLPSGAYVTLEHEYILVLRKGEKKTFKDNEKEQRRSSAFFWEERNTWYSDLWELKGIKQKMSGSLMRKRSGAYPFELVFRLINMYSMQGDTVLDPFMGTGTTMMAAVATGRNSLGVEIDEKMSQIIIDSLMNSKSDLNRRQVKRIIEHNNFVEEYKREKKKEFKYLNKYLNVPVMTQQELELKLSVIEKIEKVTDYKFKAYHNDCSLVSDESYRLIGFDES